MKSALLHSSRSMSLHILAKMNCSGMRLCCFGCFLMYLRATLSRPCWLEYIYLILSSLLLLAGHLFFFFFLWKYLVTVYTLCAIYAVQSMKNTWKFLHCLSPQLHKSCITFCMATHFYGVMGSSLPAAPALGPQHLLGILVLQVWTLPGGQRRGEVQSPLSPIFMLLDRKISPSYCLVALQCLQHSRNLALLFVSILWKTRVMQRIFPQVQLVEYSKEMVFATGDAAVH